VVILAPELVDDAPPPRSQPAPIPVDQVDIPKYLRDGKVFYEMGKLADAQDLFKAVLGVDPGNAAAKYYLGLMAAARTNQVKGIVSADGLKLFMRTFKVDRATIGAAVERQTGASLSESPTNFLSVLRQIFAQAGVDWASPAGKSIFYNDRRGYLFVKATESDLDTIEQLVGMLVNAPPASRVPGATYLVTNPAVMERELDWLRSLSVPSTHTNDSLATRTYIVVDPLAFGDMVAKLHAPSGRKEGSAEAGFSAAAVAREFLSDLGVDLELPAGKAVIYDDRTGYMFVRATKSDLDVIETALRTIDQSLLPQVHLKAWFIEVPAGTLEGIKGLQMVTNVSPAGITGLLTAKDAQAALRALQARAGVADLGIPEVTLLPGRMTSMHATEVRTVVTNMMFQGGTINQDGTVASNVIAPQTMSMESGPVLDVVPRVMADLYTIDLTTTASVTEFLGYAPVPTNVVGHAATRVETNAVGERVEVPLVWPAVQTHTESTHANLYDNQTLLLVLDQPHTKALSFSGPDDWRDANVAAFIRQAKQRRTQVLVFVTATMIDPAGNRIHSDDQMPFAQTGFPAQPGN
jgi:hypothetical protein